ncbi:MAG: PP2C family protein-serine/threonine phosphatase [Tepidisphaerales bacterium]
MFGLRRYPDPHQRLEMVVELMREISLQEDPRALAEMYARRMAELLGSDAMVSLSRRGHSYPEYRVTRSTRRPIDADPWREPQRQPRHSGGLAAELLYSDKPHYITPVRLMAGDPLAAYLDPQTRLLVAIPHYDRGKSINMVLHAFRDPTRLSFDDLPELVWQSNLFGRGVSNLALSRQLHEAYDALERELKVVARLQQDLLPTSPPGIRGLELAVHYQTSRNAGGDYYDFLDLGHDDAGSRLWGILVADVSGHGTPAAVVMAVTHALTHAYPGRAVPPSLLLHYLNQKLCDSPASSGGTFVTASYAVYEEQTRRLMLACAGHPPPRLLRDGQSLTLRPPKSLPLGISSDEVYSQMTAQLEPGDRLAWYTDGISESFSADGEMFGVERLDAALRAAPGEPQDLVNRVLERLGEFTGQPRGEDDRTLLVGVVR